MTSQTRTLGNYKGIKTTKTSITVTAAGGGNSAKQAGYCSRAQTHLTQKPLPFTSTKQGKKPVTANSCD